jgi:hypothetical protein
MSATPWQTKLMDQLIEDGDVLKIVVLQAVFGWRFVDPEEAILIGTEPNPANPLPAAGRYCDISVDGYILTHWVTMDGTWTIEYLATADGFRDAFRRLADRVKLDDADRITFFEELRKWVREDKRPQAEGEWAGPSKNVL